jgi:hypothetical protein
MSDRRRGEALFHVSEDATIARFKPRTSPLVPHAVVWAVEAARLCNYLVPRDCPRVTFYAGPTSSARDIARFLGRDRAVVAIGRAWLDRARTTPLCCYHLPPATFELFDATAGYHLSRETVIPLEREIVRDPVAEIAKRGAELRVLPDLWSLHDAILASTLEFSMIRMRNAPMNGGPVRLPSR